MPERDDMGFVLALVSEHLAGCWVIPQPSVLDPSCPSPFLLSVQVPPCSRKALQEQKAPRVWKREPRYDATFPKATV